MTTERLKQLRLVEKLIGYTFKNTALLDEALTHASYANEHGARSYERLEFLGDSVLGMTVSVYLMKRYPDKDEGFLTKAKAQIVSGPTLARRVEDLGIVGYVLHGAGKASAEVAASAKVKEDIFEAVTGAIMTDGGLAEAEKFIKRLLNDVMEKDFSLKTDSDSKSRLLETVTKRGAECRFEIAPTDDGNPPEAYVAEVYIDGSLYGTGRGRSKKRAVQAASAEALKKFK